MNHCKEMMLKMQNGEITQEAYTAKLQAQILHDKKLKAYFDSINDKPKSEIVIFRFQVITEELRQAKEQS